MQLQMDTGVSSRFYSCKCRYKEATSDNQFLGILISHFERCQNTQDLLNGEPIWTENFHEEGHSQRQEQQSSAMIDERNGSGDCQNELSNGKHSASSEDPEPEDNLEQTRPRPSEVDADDSNISPPFSPEPPPMMSRDGQWNLPGNTTNTGVLHTCPFCKFAYGDEAAYHRHITSHVTASLYPFPCQQCGEKFRSQEGLITHHMSVHRNGSSSDAASPGEDMTPASAQLPCRLCRSVFDDTESLNRHFEEAHNFSPSPPLHHQQTEGYRCACGLQFPWPEQMAVHRQTCSIANGHDFMAMEREMDNSPMSVPLPRRFLSPPIPATPPASTVQTGGGSALDLSVRGDVPPRAVGLTESTVCPECKHSAPSREALYSHFEAEHKFEGSFPCTCGNSYDWLPNFLRHYVGCPIAATDLQDVEQKNLGDSIERRVSAGEPHGPPLVPTPPLPIRMPYSHQRATPVSSAPTPTSMEMPSLTQSQEQQHHPGFNFSQFQQHKMAGEGKPILIFSCPQCSQQFTSHVDLARHLSICAQLNRSNPPVSKEGNAAGVLDLKQSQGNLPPPPLTSTQNSAPPDQMRPFKCTYCTKSFKSKALLDQHMHIHYPPKYTCRFCGKKYRWPPVFYHHQRTCKKRPPPTSVAGNGNGPAVVSTTSTPTVVSQHHQNGLSAPPASVALYAGSLPPPPLGAIKSEKESSMSQMQSANHLTCLCGFKFDDLAAYVGHVNSCQVLLARLTTGHRGHPHHVAMMPPPHHVAMLQQHHASLVQQQQQHQQQQHQQTSAMMAAAVAAAMSNAAGQSLPLSPSLINASMRQASSPGPKRLGGCIGSGGNNLCSQCGKEFSSRLSLKQHIEGKHSAEGKYLCPGCGKRYRWGASYYYHKKSCPAAKEIAGSDLAGIPNECHRLSESMETKPLLP